MDKSILEILAQLLASQSSPPHSRPIFEQKQDNPAFNNYPKEAFIQSVADSQPHQQQPQQFANITNPLLNLSGGGNNQNGNLPLLLSMLGKNPNGISGILEALTKNNGEKADKSSPSPTIDDEILL